MSRYSLSFVVMVAATAVLVGCSAKVTTKEWVEEVQFDDGSMIRIQREVTFNETNALGGGAYNSVEQASTLKFTGDLAGLPAWSVPLLAHTLYRDAATMDWVVVAITSSCDVWHALGAPNPPYWEFRLGATGWREVPLSSASVGRRSNLLRRYQLELPSGLISVAQKAQMDKDIKRLDQMTKPERMFRIVLGDTEQFICN